MIFGVLLVVILSRLAGWSDLVTDLVTNFSLPNPSYLYATDSILKYVLQVNYVSISLFTSHIICFARDFLILEQPENETYLPALCVV